MKACYYKATSVLLSLLLVLSMLCIPTFSKANQKIFHLTNGRNSAEIPFKLVQNLIIVPVMLDGKKPLNFILDTGTSSAILFNRKYLSGLSPSMGRAVTFYGAGKGKAVQGQVINGIALHLSGAATERIGMVVLNINPFDNLRLQGIPIHGVLGAVLFKCFVVEVDFIRQVLRLHEYETFTAPQDYEMLPLKLQYDKPIIRACITMNQAAVPVNLMIDTGFNNELLLYFNRQSPVTLPEKTKTRRIGVGYSGQMTSKVGFTHSLGLGSQAVEEVITIFPREGAYQLNKSTEAPGRHGTLGVGILKNFNIIFDYTGGRFYLKKKEETQPEELLAALKAKS